MAYAQKEILAPQGPHEYKNSHWLLAMTGHCQNNRDSDQGMKNSGSPPQALRSYPQQLTSQAGPASPSRRWRLGDPNET